MGFDLSIVWFAIIVFATLMYIVMDGFDLGIGILMPMVTRGEARDTMVNSVAPVWDGNETWLVLGISLWPNIIPPSVTLWQAASPPQSQGFMLVGALFIIPFILMYTFWSYAVFGGKVTDGEAYH
ncbi:cytochrome d ubiquinol oxidase subunit II [Vibrio fluvialis]